MTIASRVEKITPSGIRVVMGLAAERSARGLPVLHMEVGEPNFPTPPHVIEGAFEATRAGATGYTANAGTPALREAVADRVRTRTGITVSAENVCITTGAVMGLYLALQAILEPGDEVLLPDPGWPNYFSAVSMAAGVGVPYALTPGNEFTLDIEELERALTPRTRVILINFPGNPTGATITAARMRELLEFARLHDLVVLSDEVYEDFTYEGAHSCVLLDGLSERLIMVSGASKTYSMTGWRIGWIVAAPTLIQAVTKLVEPVASCPSAVSQSAALAALLGPQDSVAEMHASYKAAVSVVDDILGTAGLLPFRPRGAFYALIDISGSGLNSDDFTRALLDEKGVAVAPGATFGQVSAGFVRISTALREEDLRRGCEVIRDFVGELALRDRSPSALSTGENA